MWIPSALLLAFVYRGVPVVALSGYRSWIIPHGVKFGDLKRLVLRHQKSADGSAELPCVHNSTVRVATKAVGLNFADIFTILGYYNAANLLRQGHNSSAKKKRNDCVATFCPGLEFSGILLDDSPPMRQGDRVFGFTRFGAYSDAVTTSPNNLRKLPDMWSHSEGASFLVNALTAWHGLMNVAGLSSFVAQKQDFSKINNAVVVLVHSASGGVGLWASEIAARSGAVVVGIVGRQDKLAVFEQRIRPLCPAAQCIVRSPNVSAFEKNLCNATIMARALAASIDIPEPFKDSESLTPLKVSQAGWGATVVMESYGGKYFQPSLEIINAGGSMATYGSTTYNGSGRGSRIPLLPLVWQYLKRPRIDPGVLSSRNVIVGGFNLIYLTENNEALTKALRDCIACLSGVDCESSDEEKQDSLDLVAPPLVGKTFNFGTSAIEALSFLRSGMTVGKVVLENLDNPLLFDRDS